MKLFSARSPLFLLGWNLLVLLLASRAEAGENRWTPIGVGAGIVQGLAVDPAAPGVLYAAAGTAGIYRSTDAATTWQWRGAATAIVEDWAAVVVAPDDPQRLYAVSRNVGVGSGGFYTSGDAGLHWQNTFRSRVGFNAVAVSRNGTLLAIQPTGAVLRSVDGGTTWAVVLRLVVFGDPPLALAFDPLAPESAYIGNSTGLWKSTDGGATWQRIGTLPDGSPVENAQTFAFFGDQPGHLYALLSGRLYRSEDGGQTWSGSGTLSPSAYSNLAVDPRDPETVFLAGGKIYVSHDAGATVRALDSPPFENESFNIRLAISPAAPEILYATVRGRGVAVSTDGGEHWTLHEQQGLSADTFNLSLFYAAPSGRLYHRLFSGGDFFRSLDRGAHWSPLTPIPDISTASLTEEPSLPDNLWIAAGTLRHSTDGGLTWSPPILEEYVTSVASPSPGVVLAGGCGIQRSADRGRTWTETLPCVVGENGGLTYRRILHLGVPHGWPGTVWAEVDTERSSGGGTRLLFFSRDSGRTWRKLAKEFEGVAASRGVIYLGRDRALQRSRDGGKTWEVLPIARGARALTIAVDVFDPDVVYVGTGTIGVLRSADGGATWSEVNAGLARLGRLWINRLMTDPAAPGVVYAFPLKGGVFAARFGESD